jgi:hypothetical protein
MADDRSSAKPHGIRKLSTLCSVMTAKAGIQGLLLDSGSSPE